MHSISNWLLAGWGIDVIYANFLETHGQQKFDNSLEKQEITKRWNVAPSLSSPHVKSKGETFRPVQFAV
jgi:hypothetical protein